jgi:hypothetical protein
MEAARCSETSLCYRNFTRRQNSEDSRLGLFFRSEPLSYFLHLGTYLLICNYYCILLYSYTHFSLPVLISNWLLLCCCQAFWTGCTNYELRICKTFHRALLQGYRLIPRPLPTKENVDICPLSLSRTGFETAIPEFEESKNLKWLSKHCHYARNNLIVTN